MKPLGARHTAPRVAAEHTIFAGRNRIPDAVSLVTVYIVLLFAIPSNVTINGLGSLGRPAMLWGLVLFALWVLSRLGWRSTPGGGRLAQPVRTAFVIYLVITLVSFAAAMLRGQPAAQVSPAISTMIILISSAGVLLVIMDGVRTMNDVGALLRRIAIGAALLAALALLQVLTQQYLLDFWRSVPGLSVGFGGLAERNGQVRAAATATHPLEFVTTINAALSICVAAALSGGFRTGRSRAAVWWWWGATAWIAVVALTGLSRTAIIGFIVALAAMIPAAPRRFRAWVIAGGIVITSMLVVAVPGLASSTLRLFTGAAEDGSTLSRTDALARLGEFMAPSPLIGVGPGTFLPEYYIFDNEWAVSAIQLGILGVLAFAGMLIAAAWSAGRARASSRDPDVRIAGYALAVAVLNTALQFAFFDGLSFPIAAGLLFVLVGLCGAIRTVATTEATPLFAAGATPMYPSSDALSTFPPRSARDGRG
ncbi:O-antigen ligase family protein [Microbacterium sp. KHB019]|uniref:O-antigen ligase family protein n=1 Tax=Microbacterium sp. KHB019 TaxID=3129770 RepID=UPI00307A8796